MVQLRLQNGALAVAAELGAEDAAQPTGALRQDLTQPKPGAGGAPGEAPAAAGPGISGPSLFKISVAAVLGLFLGFLLGWFGLHRAGLALRAVPVGTASSRIRLPGLDSGADKLPAWLLPHAAARQGSLVALATALAAQGRVLLVPLSGSRQALTRALADTPGVYWLAEDRPTASKVAAAASAAAEGGEALVLVEGPEALQAPSDDQPAGAVLEDLNELQGDHWTLLALLLDGEGGAADASLALLQHERGDLTAGGAVVIQGDAQEYRLAVQPS